MSDKAASRTLPSLRRYLLAWFTGCAIVMAIAYTELLDYYLVLGIDLRTQSFLERTAEAYAHNFNAGQDPDMPVSRNLVGYRDLSDIPPHLLALFPTQRLQHGEAQRFVNLDFDANDEKEFAVDTLDFCIEGTCELLFLYTYEIRQGQWLYLVHGIVGSEEIYEELELSDRVAVTVGTLFVGMLLLIAILLVRNIDAPLRKLNFWSAAQNSGTPSQDIPDLRFRELDTLARRIQFAFERMREGVDKEEQFLRHASHELRTPIAILSANVELIDRLSARPERTEAEQAAFKRQYQALDEMKLLMETLLWINRQTENTPKPETIDLREELAEIADNYRYLLDAKDVAWSVHGDATVKAPAAAVRVVLSNLLRNAFQYTVAGAVKITISKTRVSIENVSAVPSSAHAELSSDVDYGFGFGLELVSRICARFEWQFTSDEVSGGRVTSVVF